MAQESWRGTWWEAANPDTTRPGVLYRDEADRFRLELIGGFDIEIREPLPSGNGYAVKMDSRKLDMIHGTAEGTFFTLMGLQHAHTSGGFTARNITKQDWTAQRVLKGIHLSSPDEQVFTRLHLQFDYLLHWTHRSTYEITMRTEQGKPPDTQVARHLEPTLHATYQGVEIGLRVRSHDFNIERRPVANRTTIQTTEWATLDFDPPQPISHDALNTFSKDLQDLLTLCAYAPAASQGQSLIHPPTPEHPGHPEFDNEVDVMGPQIYRSPDSGRDKSLHHYLFTLADIEFAELIPRWLALKQNARMGSNILFGLRYISSGYVGARLLGVASAAENIHRSLRSGTTPLPDTHYKELKKKIRAALKGEPVAARQFVHHRLHNTPTYLDRLLDLAQIPDQAVVDELLTDRTRWATLLKDSRNDLAHANERSVANDDTSVAFWLLEITYALLHLVLMAELGLDADTQRRALDHPQVNWAHHEFRRVLATVSIE
jgi:hypothetical protein